MALTNKNGLTPGQVTLQKEILDRFGALEAQNIELKAQNAALENHVAELKEALQKFQKESDAGQTHTLEELQLLNFCLTYTAVKSARQARDGVYTINELLRGDTSFWYDADNHQLYVRDRRDTGQ